MKSSTTSRTFSARSDRKKKGQILRNAKPPQLDPYIENLLLEDYDYMFILSIRDELIQNVMEACYKRYIEKESIKFLTHCLGQAYLDIMNTIYKPYPKGICHFFQNMPRTEEIAPLPPDNYAEYTVPFTYEEGIEDVDEIAITPTAKSIELQEDSLKTKDILQEFQELMESNRSSEEADEEMVEETVDQTSLYEQPMALYEEDQIEVASITSELFDAESTEGSLFTNIAEAGYNRLPPIQTTRCVNVRTRIEMPVERKSVVDMRPISPLNLPPLRLRGKFKIDDEAKGVSSKLGINKRTSVTGRNELKFTYPPKK